MTSPFSTITDPVVDSQFNFDILAGLLIDTGGQRLKLRQGNVTLTWTASTSAAGQTVAHGMGSTPVNVQLTPRSDPGAAGTVRTYYCSARGATNITINAEASAANSDSVVVDWLAIG